MSSLPTGQVLAPSQCIALIGSEGSMGKRYQAILKHLGHRFICFDRMDPMDLIIETCKSCSGVIIATPTDTHVKYLVELIPLNIRILCEKPITKNIDALKAVHKLAVRHNTEVSMVMQYAELIQAGDGPSHYNYFRHGNDGILWDCMQIIGLANGPVEIKEDSPIWDCVINGNRLNLSDMDGAYVSFIRSWLNGNLRQNFIEVVEMHRKVLRMHDANYWRVNRNPGEVKFHKVPQKDI